VAELRGPAAPRRHLLSVRDLARDDVQRILETAHALAGSLDRELKKLPTLRGRTVVNLFYESSTRTLASFELAAKRLSADTMSIRSAGSSVDKGESLKDTALTLAAYEPDVIVVRHPSIGAPHLVARCTDAHVVNAGDGKHQHPTQALLDLYAIEEALGRLEGVHVAVVGDVMHSRVARSLVQALALVGARATLIAPPTLLPRGIEALGCEISTDIADASAADVVYVLRMQRERMAPGEAYVPSLREYTALYGITPERVRPGQVVMHPGPMNRGVEIDPRVADSGASLVTDQVRAGLAVRMAVLYDVVAQRPVRDSGPVEGVRGNRELPSALTRTPGVA
jgi:aspartate carbamoyltransferase catalytic subunit